MTGASLIVDDAASAIVPMGSRLHLSIGFSADTPLRHPRFGYVVQSSSGERILGANNRYQPSNESGAALSTGTIDCDLGRPPLMPGRYSLSLWFGDMGDDHHIELEALSFEVTERDLWGHGQLPPPGPFLYWPTVFTVHGENIA